MASVGAVDADDVYQETWLAALRAYPGLRDDANLRGWLLTIAHRKVIDHARARARRATPVPDPDRTGAAVATADPPGAPGGELWGSVAALPDKQRTAVALRYIVDSAYPEIAALMGTTEEAARRNVHEGLRRLRKEQER